MCCVCAIFKPKNGGWLHAEVFALKPGFFSYSASWSETRREFMHCSSLGLIEHCRLSGIHIYELKMAWARAFWTNSISQAKPSSMLLLLPLLSFCILNVRAYIVMGTMRREKGSYFAYVFYAVWSEAFCQCALALMFILLLCLPLIPFFYTVKSAHVIFIFNKIETKPLAGLCCCINHCLKLVIALDDFLHRKP